MFLRVVQPGHRREWEAIPGNMPNDWNLWKDCLDPSNTWHRDEAVDLSTRVWMFIARQRKTVRSVPNQARLAKIYH